MKNDKDVLMILAIIFSVFALLLWIVSFFIDINIIYPLSCNIVQSCLILLSLNYPQNHK